MNLFSFNIKKSIFFIGVFFSFVVSAQAQTALEFNGTSSYVEIPYTATNNTAQFTVEFWARVDMGARDGNDFRAPLSNRKSPTPLAGYNFYAKPDDTWHFTAGNGGGINVWESLPGPAVVIGQWTHLAATHDGTTYRFYVNGILVSSLVAAFSANTSKPMRIGVGATESTTPQYYFPGAVDEVRIWNYARTASEINDNKNVNLSGAESGLASYYQFVNGSGTSKTASTAGILKNSPTTVNGVFPSAPTSISGTSSICLGESTTLTSTGGSTGINALDVWYAGANTNSEAFSEGWDTNGYAIGGTTINNTDNGILNVTSTNGDPQITMNNIGSFDPSVYKYINFRYRVASGTAGSAEIFFANVSNAGFAEGRVIRETLVSDNAWHIATIDMSSNSNWSTGGNITGWRFDYAVASGVTMDIDFITLSTNPIIGTGSSITVTPLVNTSYSVNRKGPNANTESVSQLVSVKPLAVLSNFNSINKTFYDGSYTITPPSTNSSGTLNYFSSNTSVASISGTTVTIVGPGVTTIQATQDCDTSYSESSIDATLTVSSVSVLTNTGAISGTNLNYVNQYGQIGGDFGLSANGAVLTVKTPIPLQNSLRINSANSQYLSFPKLSSLNATGDFTFETWIKFNSIGAGVMDPIFGGGQGDFVSVYGANFAARINVNNPCGGDRNFFLSSLLATNSWHHIALVRSGSTITAFLDGVATGNTTDCSGTFMNSLSTVLIGKNTWRGGYLDAYISNMRYVVGTAVYTTNFTPPESVLSAIDGTEFLLLANDVDFPLKDSSHNNIGVTGYGSPVLIMENGPF